MSTPQVEHQPACPRCGETDRVTRTVPSEQGFYCVCQNCWYAWHCNPDGHEAPESNTSQPPS